MSSPRMLRLTPGTHRVLREEDRDLKVRTGSRPMPPALQPEVEEAEPCRLPEGGSLPPCDYEADEEDK